MPEPVTWLLLIYKVPADPARLRATVWRRLKGLGAVYLQDGTAALPVSSPAERSLRALRNEIGGFGGVGYLMRCATIAGQAEITATYNRARDDEYAEIIDRCQDFGAEIEHELAARHLTYAELEENDEDLTKLKRWLAKVQARDVLGAEEGAKTVEAVARCEAALDGFAAQVYEAESSR
ncbi:MAG: ChrB domain-containing protein [Actinomycetota bacterium]|nr:ChrB domain-containing protein [Actinomycetota bacterium]